VAAVSTSILVGSITVPTQEFTVDATGMNLTGDDYYLYHATDALSLMAFVAARIIANFGGTCVITVKRNLRVRIVMNAARSFTWGVATQLRDLLGFTGDMAAATTHDAPNISPLLWSPGWLATPQTIAGVSGYSVDHKKRYKSDDGQRSFTHYLGSETWQDLDFDHIVSSRMRIVGTVAAQGGTFHQFYEQCAKLGVRFFHYDNVTEDPADTSTSITWPAGFGPYVLRDEFKGRWNERRVQGADVSNRLRLPLHMIAEYS
jgi:hypothetical protein